MLNNRGEGTDVDVTAPGSSGRSWGTNVDLYIFVGRGSLRPVIPIYTCQPPHGHVRQGVHIPSSKIPVINVVEVIEATIVVVKLDINGIETDCVDNARGVSVNATRIDPRNRRTFRGKHLGKDIGVRQ